jgi:hypothetical protein
MFMFIFRCLLLLLLLQATTGNRALDRLTVASQRFLQTETRSKNSTRVTTLLSFVTWQWKRFAYHLVVSLSYCCSVLPACRPTCEGGNEEVMAEKGKGEARRKARSRKKVWKNEKEAERKEEKGRRKMWEIMEDSERKENKETKWNTKKERRTEGLTRWNKDDAWMTSFTSSHAVVICTLNN